MTLARVKLEDVNVKEPKSGTSKSGKAWKMWPVGIRVQGQWINSAIFNEDELSKLQKDTVVLLDFYEEEYQGKMYKKFKLPSRIDQLEARIEALEKKIT